jgi:hypothetical protein
MNNMVNGVCTIAESNYELFGCLEPHACDVCPYNLNDKISERLEIGL